jgi:hypothetical protein
MTERYVCRALIAAWLAFVVTVAAPVVARAQDVSSLPKGHVTLVGCYVFMADPAEPYEVEFMLTDASLGPATGVTDPNCTPSGSAPFLKLRDVHNGLDQVRPSQWMEISGYLKSMRDEDDLRTFEVESFSQVPVTNPVALFTPITQTPTAAVETPQPERTGKHRSR